MICEKCWSDAGLRAMEGTEKTQTDHYHDLLKEREKNPCSEQEKAGIYWSEIGQCDIRNSEHMIVEEDEEILQCIACTGELQFIGILGDLAWHRCRDCGSEESRQI